MNDIFKDVAGLIEQISSVLNAENRDKHVLPKDVDDLSKMSAVMFLLGMHTHDRGSSPEVCLILNKRSEKVRQAGDLCCPGGRVSPRMDRLISKTLALPSFPLARWPYWDKWRKLNPEEADHMAIFFATSLRESFEEMRLNPFAVRFLGPLPSLNLQMAPRFIYPMVGWVANQKRFFPNWEVEKIVRIPLKNLLKPSCYGCYKIKIQPELLKMSDNSPYHKRALKILSEDFPCFLHTNGNETEVLWGATFRMATIFLNLVFGFTPPEISSLPVVQGTLDENYIKGGR
jgi:hypothetical protein